MVQKQILNLEIDFPIFFASNPYSFLFTNHFKQFFYQ